MPCPADRTGTGRSQRYGAAGERAGCTRGLSSAGACPLYVTQVLSICRGAAGSEERERARRRARWWPSGRETEGGEGRTAFQRFESQQFSNQTRLLRSPLVLRPASLGSDSRGADLPDPPPSRSIYWARRHVASRAGVVVRCRSGRAAAAAREQGLCPSPSIRHRTRAAPALSAASSERQVSLHRNLDVPTRLRGPSAGRGPPIPTAILRILIEQGCRARAGRRASPHGEAPGGA